MANVRQTIVDAMQARFSDLTGIKRVDVWRVSDLPPTDLPAILIRDTLDTMPTDSIGSGRIDHALEVEVTILVAGNSSPEEVRDLLNSVAESIGTDPTWSDIAFDTKITAAEIDLDAASQLVAYAQLNLIVNYRTAGYSL